MESLSGNSQTPSSPSDPSWTVGEQDLIARLRTGDAAAYETLVRTYGGRLLQVARRYLDEEDARDALQEAFVSAWKAIGQFDGQSKISTWLHRIVINASLMRLRKKSTKLEQATESLEPLLPTYLEDGHRADVGAAWEETPEELLDRQEVRALVRRGIHQLPEGYRTVVLLRDIEGLSGQETADVMGLTLSAVKVRLHRARQALRTILDDHLAGASNPF